MTDKTGSCLCGAVRFVVNGPLGNVSYCHCSQCRKTSGHFVAAVDCSPGDLQLLEDKGLRWFRSSAIAQRGFCENCGSSLFWRPEHGRHVSIMAGVLDLPTGLQADEHIFVDDASDYYVIDDGLPQFAGDSPRGSEA
ncbi:MAG: GFA family protein [Gammaproteobacteria bacterium]|jgi:hypothetical protein|nr:GFA family protein [Gammaproteobacteria bacterium]MDH3907975.1 GFA family protein [Gammaproteobacteria bacterium]